MVEIIGGKRWFRCECGELIRYEYEGTADVIAIDSSGLEHECPYSEDIEDTN